MITQHTMDQVAKYAKLLASTCETGANDFASRLALMSFASHGVDLLRELRLALAADNEERTLEAEEFKVPAYCLDDTPEQDGEIETALLRLVRFFQYQNRHLKAHISKINKEKDALQSEIDFYLNEPIYDDPGDA